MRLQVYKEGKFVSLEGANTLSIKKQSFGWLGCLVGVVAMFAPSLFSFPGWLVPLWYIGLVWLAIHYLGKAYEKSAMPALDRLVVDVSEGLFSIESMKGEEQEVWDLPISSIRTIQFRTLSLVNGLRVEAKPPRDLPFEMQFDLHETVSPAEITVYAHVEGIQTTLHLFKFGGLLGSLLGMDAQFIQQQQQEDIGFSITHDTAPLRELGIEIIPPQEDATWLTDRLFGTSDGEDQEMSSSFFEPEKPTLATTSENKEAPRRHHAHKEHKLHFPSQHHTALKTPTPTASLTSASPQKALSKPTPLTSPAKPTTPKPTASSAPPKTTNPPQMADAPIEYTRHHLPHEENTSATSAALSTATSATSTEPSASTEWQKSENNAHWPEWSMFSSSDQTKPSLNWPSWEGRDPK